MFIISKHRCRQFLYIMMFILMDIPQTLAQGIGINNPVPDPSAILDITGTTKGLLIPRVSLISAISNAPIGPLIATSLLVFNTATAGVAPNNVTPGYYYWDGTRWNRLLNTIAGGTDWQLTGNSGTIDGTHFLGTTDASPLNFRVNNQRAGRIGSTFTGTYLGYQAGNAITSGSGNTAMGHQSMLLTQTGSNNTAFGEKTLFSNTTGEDNVAIGTSALRFNVTGSYNVAVGRSALYSNTVNENTGIGHVSLYYNTTGSGNTAVGFLSLMNNTTATYNTAVGRAAMFTNVYGLNNTGIGASALYYNNASENTAVGQGSMFYNSTGYQNTALGAGSLLNNLTSFQNTAVGGYALFSNNYGPYNTAIGYKAMYLNTVGERNYSGGYQALYSNTTGNYNTSSGFQSLWSNTTGNYNTAHGGEVLYSNTSGGFNTGSGFQALFYNATGSANSAYGSYALKYNTASGNSAFGYNALLNTNSGWGNTAVGNGSLYSNMSGYKNTAVGYGSLEGYTGTQNTGVGEFAGYYVSFSYPYGNYNTFVGAGTTTDNLGRTNCIAIAGIGNIAFGGDNRVRIGNTSMSSIGGQVGWTTLSDARLKSGLQRNVPGLDFILRLQPYTYHYSIDSYNRLFNKNDTIDYPTKRNIEKIRFSGFLAQEVEQISNEIGYEFSGIDKPDDDNGVWGLRYAEFVVPLVKAVQEQQQLINSMQHKIDAMQKEIERLKGK